MSGYGYTVTDSFFASASCMGNNGLGFGSHRCGLWRASRSADVAFLFGNVGREVGDIHGSCAVLHSILEKIAIKLSFQIDNLNEKIACGHEFSCPQAIFCCVNLKITLKYDKEFY